MTHWKGWLCGLFAVLLRLPLFAAAPYGLDSIDRVGIFLDGKIPSTRPSQNTNWKLIPAFPALTFTNTMGLTQMPGTTKLVVWEREGHVWMFEKDTNTSEKIEILDLSDRCQGWGGGGLLGLAFHPGFATNHYVYVYYTWVMPGTVTGGPSQAPVDLVVDGFRDRLSRFELDSDLRAIDGSELVLVDQVTSSLWHDGGGLFFHPDNGFLYWTDGDDLVGLSQAIDRNLLSGVFRIDVDMRGGDVSHPIRRQPENGMTANYYIPFDNPFDGLPGVLEEFFALGLRSPHRMTLDEASGRIFIGDVGENTWEEVDVIEPSDPPGLNFQWVAVEGTAGDFFPPFVGVSKPPYLEYGHDEGVAVIGGYVYRGKEFAAELGGKYIFADNGSAKIWAMDESTSPPGKELLCTFPVTLVADPVVDNGSISSFGVDADNELYFCQVGNYGAQVFKLARNSGQSGSQQFPSLLSQTGAFTNLPSLSPRLGLLPYSVNSPLWSDGAHKDRWMGIPPFSQILAGADGEFLFPGGSVFVKHFELAQDETNPTAARRRLETRILTIAADRSVFGATYKWREDNSDADLITNRLDEAILIKTQDGVKTQVWHYPSPGECLLCHNAKSRGVLGATPGQLNGDMLYPSGIVDNQLRTWNHLGLISPKLVDANIETAYRLVSPSDTGQSLETRVRSYLDANCSFCHHPGGTPAAWDGRATVPLSDAGIVNGNVGQKLGLPNAKVVVPGHPENSVLFVRGTSTNSTTRMPPVGRNVVDVEAMSLVDSWIRSLGRATGEVAVPWCHDDIGPVTPPGDAAYENGVLKIVGGGPDIYYTKDSFHFVYQQFTGDGELSARITSLDDLGQTWTKAGIMVRESLGASARNLMYFVTPAAIQGRIYRTTAYDDSVLNFWAASSLPYWMKLARKGSTITGSTSKDGEAWVVQFSQNMDLPASAYIGFAVASRDPLRTTTAQFDNIRGTGMVGPMNYPPSAKLTSPTEGLELDGRDSAIVTADASDSDGQIAKVEFFDGISKIAQIDEPPFTFTWQPVPLGVHVLTARATDDRGATFASPSVTVTNDLAILQYPWLSGPSGGIQISFLGMKGGRYVVERSPDLHDWVPISTNTLDSSFAIVPDVGPLSDQSFYRVRATSN